MKKIMILSVVAVAATLTSCVSEKTATQGVVSTTIASAVTSDLEVSNAKISYTYSPSRQVRRAGKQNSINVAISEALAQHGGGDVLVETQEAVILKKGIFPKIKKVTVTGYPAKYKNFKPVDEETVKQGIVNGSFPKTTVLQNSKGGLVKRRRSIF